MFTTDDTDPTDHYQSIPPLLVRNEGILKLLQRINPSKSFSPDEVAGGLFKELTTEVASFPTYLFNKSPETGEGPAKWKEQYEPHFQEWDQEWSCKLQTSQSYVHNVEADGTRCILPQLCSLR